jgi:hypothetical protein
MRHSRPSLALATVTLEQHVGPVPSDSGLTGLPWRDPAGGALRAWPAAARPDSQIWRERREAGTHCQSHSVTCRDWRCSASSVANRLVRLSPTAAPWPRRPRSAGRSPGRRARRATAAVNRGPGGGRNRPSRLAGGANSAESAESERTRTEPACQDPRPG